MRFPAVKTTDMVMGVDFHTVLIVVPRADDAASLLRRHLPVDDAGLSEDQHADQQDACRAPPARWATRCTSRWATPTPPTMLNMGYWRRHLLNVPKALMLVALTLLANLAISGIASLFVKPDSATGKFVKDVTGVDTSSWGGVWDTVKGSFSAYTQWSTWIKLLMPPVPFPGSQGSSAIGSPNVTVNGGALGFVAPLMGDVLQRPANCSQCDADGV